MSRPHQLPPGRLDLSDMMMALSPLMGGLVFAGAGFAALQQAFSPLRIWLVLIGILAIGAAILGALLARGRWRELGQLAAVRERGLPLTATVLAARPTGVKVNKRRVVDLTLRIQHPKLGERTVALWSTVPGRRDGAVEVGEPLSVRAHPWLAEPVVLVPTDPDA